MAEAAAQNGPNQIVCPHCKRTFEGELLEGSAARYRGFKCPHCRLFVPVERSGDEPTAAKA